MSNSKDKDITPAEALNSILGGALKTFNLKREDIVKISSVLKPLNLDKGEIFCRKGHVCDKIGILMNGLLYAYYESEKGNEEVSRFFFINGNFIVSSFDSFINKKPANETIKAIEKSEILCISYKSLHNLYETIPQMNFIGRQLAEQSYVRAMQRVHDLQALDAKGRVEKFLGEHPDFYNRIKKKHLASYLGMNYNLVREYFKPANGK
jgi:CRP-like cAMP-binding protein